ncbi:MAG: dTMP kinase [Legionella sp.]|nr:dTMP kinase [Legionella sp.]
MQSLSGKLIVIEGLEGAGKSTAVHTLIALLSQRSIPVLTVREPGGTPIGETIRSIIKNPEYETQLDDKSELLLMYTARMQLLEQVIKPALKQGSWVIADRFELSTLAYQGGGRGLDKQMIQTLSNFCLQGFKPDLTLYLDISPERGMQRARLRGQFDRIEQQPLAFFNKVHQSYIQQLKDNPQIVRIDASLPIEAVQANIQAVIEHFLKSLYE